MMQSEMTPTGPSKDFESIKKIDENFIEYWTGRELMIKFGYQRWEAFDELVSRAANAALQSGQEVLNHFRRLTKMVEIGSGTVREIKDWKLDRYACYLVAQNGDSSKQEIALAQTYFAIQTRKQELFETLSDSEKRLLVRGEVTKENKKLFSTAKQSGVSNFGSFNDAGYQGLYGMSLAGAEKRKGVKKGSLLDHAGSTELAANLFRITQTDEKLKMSGFVGQENASRVHNMVGGKVRQTIKDIGGVLPENLKPERYIKELKKEAKLLENQKRKKSGK